MYFYASSGVTGIHTLSPSHCEQGYRLRGDSWGCQISAFIIFFLRWSISPTILIRRAHIPCGKWGSQWDRDDEIESTECYRRRGGLTVTRSWVGWMIISQFYANSFRWFVEQFARWVDGEWAADSSELEYNFWLLETSGNNSGSECGIVENLHWRYNRDRCLFWLEICDMSSLFLSITVLVNWINMMSGQKELISFLQY